MIYEMTALLLSLALLIWKKAVDLENRLSGPSIQGIPFIREDISQEILLNFPRDQAMEKLEALCPELENVGMFEFKYLNMPRVFVTDSKLIRDVVMHSDDFPKEEVSNLMTFLFGQSVLFSNGDVWLKHHKVLQSSFSQTKFTELISSSFESLANHWERILSEKGSTPLVVHDWVGSSLFAYGYNYHSISQHSKHFDYYMQLIDMLEKFTPMVLFDLNYQTRQKVYDHFYCLIRNRRVELGTMSAAEMGQKIDVLSMMIAKFPEYDDNSIAEDLMTLFFAGHDTTSASITFNLYLLAKNPQFQYKARMEAKKFMETLVPGEELTEADLKERLPYLYAVILESWRLLPPAAGTLSRVAGHDNVYLGGQHIPEGTVVFCSLISSHHSKQVWGNDASEFNPARFCFHRDFSKGIDREVARQLLTFSAGPRVCLGQRFATIQVFLGLARLLSQFHFELPKDSPHAERCQVRPFIAIIAPVNLELLVSHV